MWMQVTDRRVWRPDWAGGGSTCWMNAVSIGEYHGLRVGSALLSIVAGCIIIGVSKDCDADAVGGIFLGAGGLGKYHFSFRCLTYMSINGYFLRFVIITFLFYCSLLYNECRWGLRLSRLLKQCDIIALCSEQLETLFYLKYCLGNLVYNCLYMYILFATRTILH